jgi:hypothetical protein
LNTAEPFAMRCFCSWLSPSSAATAACLSLLGSAIVSPVSKLVRQLCYITCYITQGRHEQQCQRHASGRRTWVQGVTRHSRMSLLAGLCNSLPSFKAGQAAALHNVLHNTEKTRTAVSEA